MADDMVKSNVMRMILWGAAALLALVSFFILVLNFRTLQETTVFAEKSAVKQAENFRYYVNEYKVTKVALDEANQKLVDLTRLLEQANLDLAKARGDLASVQALNDQLKTSIQVLERYKLMASEKGEALETMLMAFKKKNKEIDLELQGARKELAVFKPDINDLGEGRSKVQMFKEHINMVKKNMGILRQKADEAREVAQKESDRLEALYGNGGFLVKDGQDKSVNTYGQRHMNVDVKILNK
jgi:chromosome segregation ATPase